MPTRHEVQPGDCVTSLAHGAGFFPDTVWNDAENTDLRQKRKQMNLLEPGDVVVIPDLRVKEESGGTDATHRFRRKGVPAKLKLKVLRRPEDQGVREPPEPKTSGDGREVVYEEPPVQAEYVEEPWAQCPYVLDVDGKLQEGLTDGDGMVEAAIPPDARDAKLKLNPGKPDERVMTLRLGTLGDRREVPGVKRRLANLGYDCGNTTEQDADQDAEFAHALRMFQEFYGLDRTGALDEKTKGKVKELCD
jgi:hypothetical protein